MQVQNRVKNVVFVGSFNPALFDKYFFIKNDIVKEEEILPNSIFESFGIINILTKNCTITIFPNQIIINDNQVDVDSTRLSTISIALTQAMTSQTVSAIGFNFTYFLGNGEMNISDFSRNYFYNDKINLISNFFNSSDS